MREVDLMRLAAKPFGFAAAIFLVLMMLYTTVTVVLRQFLGVSVIGVVDVMELLLVCVIFFAMPAIFLRDENVTVDIIDQFISRRVRAILRMTGLVIALGFLLIVFIPMLPEAIEKYKWGEVTMTLKISRFVHWIPILIGFGGAILATVWVFVHYARHGVPRDVYLDKDPAGQ